MCCRRGEQAMIRKLQYKFIGISCAAVIIVMASLLIMLNQMFSSNILRQNYRVLTRIADNDGVLPDEYGNSHRSREADAEADTKGDIDYDTDGDSDEDAEDADREDYNERLMREHLDAIHNQVQYFSVWMDPDDQSVKRINLDHFENISESEAEEYAAKVMSGREDKGVIREEGAHPLCFLTRDLDEERIIVFMDCSWDYESVRALRRFSLWFSLVCLVFFLIVVSALSRRAIRPVIRNMENQKQFITNAGHELKTPLAIISANTEVLEMMEGENEWTRSTMNQVDRLNRLVRNLIVLARMGETSEEEVMEVDFSAAVTKAAEDFASLAGQKGLLLKSRIEPGLTVKGRESHLTELINILCDNALKYCDDQGEVSIDLYRKSMLKGIVFEVSNSYAQGNKEECSRFFERFYRGDRSHNSKKEGYGIGLSMAEGFVREARGKITADYRDGKVVLTVIFP